MKNGKVSIIMPAYNAAEYLDRSIASVCNQTYQDWELLVVDDGSQDHSREIVQSYASEDSRIKLLCNAHGGTARARNTAIDAAQGDYLAFIDADDVYHPRYLEKLIGIAQHENSNLAICEIAQVTEPDAIIQSNVGDDYTVIGVDQAFAATYGGEWAIMISPCNKLYARHLFDAIRFPNDRCFEDLATVNLLLYYSNKICVVREPLYFYFTIPNSSSKTKKSVELLDREWALRSHWEFFFQEGRNDLAYQSLPFYLVELIVTYHRIESSDRPEDCVLVRKRFEEVYRKYHRDLVFSSSQKERILAFRHPNLYDIRNMIRQDGIVGTLAGFVKRKFKQQ